MVNYYCAYEVNDDDGHRYTAIPVPPDGSCFYHSISYHLFQGDINCHEEVRMGCLNYIRGHPHEFQPFLDEEAGTIEELLQYVSTKNSWADHYEILATANYYNHQICVFRVNSSIDTVTLNPNEVIGNGPVMNVMFHDSPGHYWPLIRKANADNTMMTSDCEREEKKAVQIKMGDCNNKSRKRKHETSEVREDRLRRALESRLRKKESETLEDRNTRLRKNRESRMRKRNSETPEEREARLRKAREYRIRKKNKPETAESLEEGNTRLRKNRERRMRKRNSETPEERQARLRKAREYRIRKKNKPETAEEKAKRLQADRNKRKHLEKLKNEKPKKLSAGVCEDEVPVDVGSVENEDEEGDSSFDSLIAVSEHVIAVEESTDDDRFDEDLLFDMMLNVQRKLPKAMQTYVEEDCPSYYIGKMTGECVFCRALYFPCERNTKKVYTKCCQEGKVYIPHLENYKLPELIEVLLTEKTHPHHENFRENIRQYNSALSFASFGASKVIQMNNNRNRNTRGPYCFKIQGTTYHQTSNLLVNNRERPQYAQLYIIETGLALEERKKVAANESCKEYILGKLDELIREINKYAKTLKMLGELQGEEDEKCRRNGEEPLNYQIALVKNRNVDPRRYNLPTCNEIAAVFTDRDGEPPFERDIQIHRRDGVHIKLNLLSPHLDPMTYVLLYPSGEFGWDPEMRQIVRHGNSRKPKRDRITQLQYYAYLFSARTCTFLPYLHAGKLTQQFMVDTFCRSEANRLNFIRCNQAELRIEFYQGLYDYLHGKGANQRFEVGRTVILPSSFVGSPRAMQQHYQDAMAIVAEIGPPDLFITFTANPNWREVQENLRPFEKASDRPDLVARVFNQKRESLLNDMRKEKIFGEIEALVAVIEYQKRGLPHMHVLVTLTKEAKIRTTRDMDRAVRAEIPDVNTEPRIHDLVKRNMVHGPCGANFNMHSVCISEGKCTKRYPKELCEESTFNENGFPKYRRRRDGRTITVGKYTVDNKFIVPYNPYLLAKYKAHINVEVCSTVQSVKYLFKYLHKGHDSATIAIIQEGGRNVMDDENVIVHDEISMFQNTRYISAPESIYRLFKFKMHFCTHTIYRLAVHEEMQQTVCFRCGEELAALAGAADRRTTLTAWFALNKTDPHARELRYQEIPKYYTFDKKNKPWSWRFRNTNTGGNKVIGRMHNSNIRERERHFLRLLLLHQKGCTSFADVRTVNNVVYSTYCEAATALGLLTDDKEWDRAMTEAAMWKMPRSLRQLFATICVFSAPTEPLKLWKKHLPELCEDFKIDVSIMNDDSTAEQKALAHVSELLALHGKKLSDFNLPELNRYLLTRQWQREDDEYDLAFEKECADDAIAMFNPEQRSVFDEVMKLYHEYKKNQYIMNTQNNMLSINAAAGTGKTFLYIAIMHALRALGEIVIPISWTGISASLLPGGRTVHSVFKLPVPLKNNSMSSLHFNCDAALRIKRCAVILWDEITMSPYPALDAVDKFLQELMQNKSPFGGKIIVFGGDWMQCLPVVQHGTRAMILEQTAKNSKHWHHVKEYTLNQNMRTRVDASDYARWLLAIGRGLPTVPTDESRVDIIQQDCLVKIPKKCICEGDIVQEIFGEKLIPENYAEYKHKSILAPKNIDTFRLNNKVLARLQGAERVYYSADCIIDDESNNFAEVSHDYLHSLTPSGMPPHELHLKVGAIVMLLRNLNSRNGLCNGTRLLVTEMKNNVIHAKILTGNNAGQIAFLPRIIFDTCEGDMIFKMRRLQFPLRLAFSITINKAQGQTLEKVGLYLPTPVFGHGQLYVALSRARSFDSVKVKMRFTEEQGKIMGTEDVYTKNVVFHELFH